MKHQEKNKMSGTIQHEEAYTTGKALNQHVNQMTGLIKE